VAVAVAAVKLGLIFFFKFLTLIIYIKIISKNRVSRGTKKLSVLATVFPDDSVTFGRIDWETQKIAWKMSRKRRFSVKNGKKWRFWGRKWLKNDLKMAINGYK
jgi:hypothetical protein